jgi:ribosomal-protein-serine acetyltransferase
LSADDIDAYYALVDTNRDHLTQYGDYSTMRSATRVSVSEELMNASADRTRMGLWNDDALIGRIDLHEKEPGKFVLGYWLGSSYTGHGYATIACRAIIAYAGEAMDASEIYAGVTKGNTPSEALLARLGFRHIADMGSYNRFILCLNGDPGN